jgi:large subunit ribosomal protein L32e
MTTEIKRLIRTRVEKGATFKRDGYGKKRQLSDSWRKPRGQHNKQREQKKAKGALPKPGFGSPVAVRGMHPSGFFEVLITSAKQLDGIDPKTHAIRLGATVGRQTRAALQEKAIAEGFKVLNARKVKIEPDKEKVRKPAKGADTKKSEEKKSVNPKKMASSKQDTKTSKKTPEVQEKKSPAKEKKPVKPKTETAEKMPEKPETTVPAKSVKKSVKPKTDASVETKSKSAPKTKAKKKTDSEVKKNE